MVEARISIWLSCVEIRFSCRPIVRKTTGKTLKDLVAEEIAGALGVDFEIGASAKNWHRISPLVFPASKAGLAQTDTSSISAKIFGNPSLDLSVVDSPDWREAELGSGDVYGNELSIATILSCISLGGEANRVRLLLNETIDLIFQKQSKGIDLVTGQNLRFGIGFGLSGNDTELKWLPEERVCMWGGYGGSIAIMDLERSLTISYTMNKLDNVGLGSHRTKVYVGAIYNAIGV
ncbi:hypothetical protein BOTNAR_0407g00070 [Botryotinia narcissicola]|uniref:Beta-lactamase-related domain-containing protein n=1 Tax=Botryotinia narcissicola TaxID=278944 RepID=A0A4Z1HLX6_9HELO|nr:hypothetical protein BOTNAR_0407g00070 [Botryotinia narcissicola]